LTRYHSLYYRNKLAAEKLVRESGVPWTMGRATQFHSLINLVLQQMARLPIMPLATDFQFQPVDPGEVANYFCTPTTILSCIMLSCKLTLAR
jgi:uncharacterized protein YbjT (DUF2867 family)